MQISDSIDTNGIGITSVLLFIIISSLQHI